MNKRYLNNAHRTKVNVVLIDQAMSKYSATQTGLKISDFFYPPASKQPRISLSSSAGSSGAVSESRYHSY